MLSNEQMKKDRFLLWHRARKQYAFIMNTLASGKRIMVCSATKPKIYDSRHVDMFKCGKTACYVQRGKSNYDSLEYSKLAVVD